MVRNVTLVVVAITVVLPLQAQEADSGFTMPITLSVGAMYTHRWDAASPGSGPLQGGFRSMFYPSLKLGQHWFVYSALQLSSSPYFFFEANSATNRVKARVIQSFVGYIRGSQKKSITVKVGQLSSAFGSFPLRYDDTRNPLLAMPLSYGSAAYGNFPVTLYGLAGAEVNASIAHLDARLQLTNSSPVNPKNLLSSDQHINWAAGTGFTIRQGLRVGVSMYHGPYLQVGRFLLPTERSSDWPFTALGFDAQWERGRWSLTGEWQRFDYVYPRFIQWPVLNYAYLETKVVINPHLYLATRANYNAFSLFQRFGMPNPAILRPNRQALDFTVGYRLNRNQLLKVGYEWLHNDGVLNSRNNVLGVQYVTSIDSLYKAFR